MKHCAIVFVCLIAATGCKSSKSAATDRVDPKLSVDETQSAPGADPRERLLAMLVTRLLESDHLRARTIDDEISTKAFARYLEQLDPGKMYLLQRDVDRLRTYERLMDDEMHDSRLELARDGAALLVERVAVVDRMVAKVLSKPLDFTAGETIETDADKQGYCADDAELEVRWRKTLEFQVMVRIIRMQEIAQAHSAVDDGSAAPPTTPPPPSATVDAGPPGRPEGPIPATDAEREAKARTDVAKTYVGRFARLADVDPIDGPAMFLNAITTVYDPHTNYLAPRAKENFDITMSGSLEGIGAVLTEDDHYINVLEIVPGGASWRQGKLHAGDLILSVAQEGREPVDVGDMPIGKVVEMIRGPKDTIVVLTVQKPTGEVETIAITRDVVQIETAYARGAILSGSRNPVGYIYLPSFYGNTRSEPGGTPERSCTDDVRLLLEVFHERGVGGVILDLRGNGGGLLTDAQEMSGLFIERGPIVQTRGADGETEVLRDDDAEIWFGGEVIVLVDSGSASASEILAAALQDYGRAVIVGTGPTHGKGTVQVLLDLNRFVPDELPLGLGTLKLTRSQFFRINGGSTQWRGVIPDVVLPDPSAYIESGERHLPNSIPWSEVEPLRYERWSKSTWKLPALVTNSKKRQAAQAAFSLLAKRNELLRARNDQSIYPLEPAAYVARRDADRAELEAVTPDLDAGPPRFSVRSVAYGPATPSQPGEPDGAAVAAEREKRWGDNLARDPWVQETLFVLDDMIAAP